MSLLGLYVAGVSIFVFRSLSKDLATHTEEESTSGAGGYKSGPDEKTQLIDSTEKGGEVPVKRYGWDLLFSSEGMETKAVHLFISQILGISLTIIPFKFGVLFGTSGIDDVYMYYYIPSCMGSGTIVARFLAGYITSSGVNPFTVNKLLQFGCILSSLNLAFTDTASTHSVLIGLFAYALFNSHFPLVALRTVDLLGKFQHHLNFGVQSFAVGLGYCIGGYLGGFIYDVTNKSFKILFISCAVSFALAFVFDEIAFHERSLTLKLISIFAINRPA